MSYSYGELLDAIQRVNRATTRHSEINQQAHAIGLAYQESKDEVHASLENLDKIRGQVVYPALMLADGKS